MTMRFILTIFINIYQKERHTLQKTDRVLFLRLLLRGVYPVYLFWDHVPHLSKLAVSSIIPLSAGENDDLAIANGILLMMVFLK